MKFTLKMRLSSDVIKNRLNCLSEKPYRISKIIYLNFLHNFIVISWIFGIWLVYWSWKWKIAAKKVHWNSVNFFFNLILPKNFHYFCLNYFTFWLIHISNLQKFKKGKHIIKSQQKKKNKIKFSHRIYMFFFFLIKFTNLFSATICCSNSISITEWKIKK